MSGFPSQFESVLILSPHTDDAELACGGTINRLTKAGVGVRLVAFSIAEDSVREPYARDILAEEIGRSSAILGLHESQVEVLRYPVRRFASHRQEILDRLVALRSEVRPDVVLLPSSHDVHQDHAVVHAEGIRAFKHSTLLGYELPWNHLTTEERAFVALQPHHLEKKLAAIAEYKSQGSKPYVESDYLQGLARVRGVSAGVRLAEAFEVIRWIVT